MSLSRSFSALPPSSLWCRPSLFAQPLPSAGGSPPLCPLIFFSSSSCVLCTVHPPSSRARLGSALSFVLRVPPISAFVLPSDLTPCIPPFPFPSTPPSSPSRCSRDPQIFLFFSWLLPLQISFGGLITVASKTHTKSQHECYCEAHKGKQAVIAIRNRGACSEHNV